VILLAVAAGALVAGVGGALLATPIAAMTDRVVSTRRPHQRPTRGSPLTSMKDRSGLVTGRSPD
jgi:predicted PurR-regulated permease PerM